MKKHEKHPKLTLANIGKWGKNEFALLGAPCELINTLASEIIDALAGKYKVAFVDADHSQDKSEFKTQSIKFQDKISHFSFSKPVISEFERKLLLADADIILVNGNHFEAEKQIVIIDPKKEESLKKREHQLTHVIGVLKTNDAEPFGWLNNTFSTIINFENRRFLSQIIANNLKKIEIKGLILTGGKSTRMGLDKSEIIYNEGLTQKKYLFKTLSEIGLETYYSVANLTGENFEIEDKFTELGPYGAILSAFRSDPNAAWLVIACDMPLIGAEEVNFLINNRNLSKIATACYNPETDFADPLFTIWEPKAYPVLLNFLAQGYSCPRKALINSDIELIHLPNATVLKNINTAEERNEFMTKKPTK
jgi:molybdopterin-guanine dinucleotide biosynthesis protein A/molybdopterin-guanine dinucleotide biosynthesis protein